MLTDSHARASASGPLTQVEPFEAVIFDFHSTLFDPGSSEAWLAAAERRVQERALPPQPVAQREALLAYLDRIWEHAREIDPKSERDLSLARHREVYAATMARVALAPPPLVEVLYEVMVAQWTPYEDALPVLQRLRAAGLRLGLLSNAGVELRPRLAQTGTLELLDAVVVSHEVGVVKPDRRIFEHTLAALGAEAGRTLMVGDSWQDDGGAAALGMRTLILPRTPGPVRGLSLVLSLLGYR